MDLDGWPMWLFMALGALAVAAVFRELLFICYIAARSEWGALKMILVFYRLGIGVISDILGEEVTDKKTAIRATARYILHLRHLAELRAKNPKIHLAIAVKLSQLGMKFDILLARRLLKKIYQACIISGVRLEVDMEGPETMTSTLEIIRPLVRMGHDFRVAVPANQSKSKMAFRELAKRGIGVRIVKGAYQGDYRDEDAISFNYLRFACEAKKYNNDTAYGTHNVWLLKEARAIWPGISQMLYGIFMNYPADERYMPWTWNWSRKDAKRFMRRRMQEGIRPKTILLFLRNIPESLLWRLRHASFSFFS